MTAHMKEEELIVAQDSTFPSGSCARLTAITMAAVADVISQLREDVILAPGTNFWER